MSGSCPGHFQLDSHNPSSPVHKILQLTMGEVGAFM